MHSCTLCSVPMLLYSLPQLPYLWLWLSQKLSSSQLLSLRAPLLYWYCLSSSLHPLPHSLTWPLLPSLPSLPSLLLPQLWQSLLLLAFLGGGSGGGGGRCGCFVKDGSGPGSRWRCAV